MDNGDKSWMGLRRSTDEYIRGVNDFLDKAFERASKGNEILCPSEPLSLREFFVATRARKLGRSYKESDEDTTTKIAEMEKIETQQSEDGSSSVNAFAAVMGPEHPGRLRLYG
nr:uncharacterized protein LOC104095409 [Nicotiana tomentosiformis]